MLNKTKEVQVRKREKHNDSVSLLTLNDKGGFSIMELGIALSITAIILAAVLLGITKLSAAVGNHYRDTDAATLAAVFREYSFSKDGRLPETYSEFQEIFTRSGVGWEFVVSYGADYELNIYGQDTTFSLILYTCTDLGRYITIPNGRASWFFDSCSAKKLVTKPAPNSNPLPDEDNLHILVNIRCRSNSSEEIDIGGGYYNPDNFEVVPRVFSIVYKHEASNSPYKCIGS